MCAIVGLSPLEIDCDTQWLIVQDTEGMIKSPTKGWVSGLAVYNFSKYPVSDFYPELEEYDNLRWISVAKVKRDNCWNDIKTEEPVNCIPILWHEIKHQICTCNWHEDMVKTFKSFNNPIFKRFI